MMKTIINADVGILLRTGVKNRMIDCLCVFIYYIFYVLLIYFSLSFHSWCVYSRPSSTMRTCVYKWTSTNYYFYFWYRGRIIMCIVLLLYGKVHGKDRVSAHCL